MQVYSDLPDAVGKTPLIRLKAASEATGCDIYGKAEFLNPGQSVQDRAALYTIKDATAKGDLRPGGKWVIEMTNAEGKSHNVGGEYVEVDRPSSVRFTWAWHFEPEEVSEVTYRLSPVTDTSTQLTLIHTRLPSEGSRDQHAGGWNGALDNLAPWLAS